MAEQDAQYDKQHRVSGRLDFLGSAEGETPVVEVALLAPDGERDALELSPDGEFTLDPANTGKGFQIAIGPLGGDTRTFRFDDLLRVVAKTGVQRIAEPTWRKWQLFDTCVTGRVRVCRPRIFDELVINPSVFAQQHAFAQSAGPKRSPYFPQRCYPVCQGKVEVFVRTCCCPIILEPPIIIRNICEIIDCSGLIEVPIEIGPVGPRPVEHLGNILRTRAHAHVADDEVIDSVGIPVFDDDDASTKPTTAILPALEPSVARAIKRSRATEGGPDAEQIVDLARHLSALLTLEAAQQIEYVALYPDLRFPLCRCTTHKVAEVPLQSDGHFDACFSLGRLRLGCARRVQYRVSQFQGGQWVVIYDDLARGVSHALGDDAVLDAARIAQSCGTQPPTGGRPFVTLELIGGTRPSALVHSTAQNGETTYAGPLASRDGLANPAPANPGVGAGPYDQPWGQTLSLLYQLHPGLQALGATYFRTRIVQLDSLGAPIGEFAIDDGLSWAKYFQKPPTPAEPLGGVGVTWIELHDAIPGVGMYKIPYPDLQYPWLGGQYHAQVDTARLAAGAPRMPNGKYTFVVDIFDGSGKRMVPDSSGQPVAPGEVGPFPFDIRRTVGPPLDTVVVQQKALATLFHVDNLATFGDIEQILHNGTPSAQNCQFLEGPGSDQVRLRYSAYHDNHFQWYHTVAVKQGLTGPVTTLVTSDADVHHGDTGAVSIAALLGSEPRCAFAATLTVKARHTNGSTLIAAYDSEDIAAFALENTTP